MSKPQFGEPWVGYVNSDGLWTIRHQLTKRCVSNGLTAEDAQRILAAVNACASLSDEQLKRVRAVNELYEACRKSSGILGNGFICPENTNEDFERGWNAACKAFSSSLTKQDCEFAIALAEGKEGE